MSTTEERTLKWLNDNIDFFTRYRAEPINANRTAFYDEMIERQRTAISAIETCRQLKKSLFGKENVTNDELVRMVLQLKSGRWMLETGGRTMKTPDEIKKSLRMCTEYKCAPSCLSYEVETNCRDALMEDALACIEQLENHVEPKNRVLTPEELKAYCEGGADAAPLW